MLKKVKPDTTNKFIQKEFKLKPQKEVKEKSKKQYPTQVIMDQVWNPEGYKKITRKQKSNASFLLNRFMAISYPVISATMSRMGVSDSNTVDFWVHILRSKFNSTPGFFYTKINRNFKLDFGDKLAGYDKEIVSQYLCQYQCSKKDLMDGLEFNEEETRERLEQIKEFFTWKEGKKMLVE